MDDGSLRVSVAEPFAELVGVINRCGSFLLATHIRPDGDAIGSLTALTGMLRRLGKEVTPCCQDEAPPGHEFLLRNEVICHGNVDPADYEAAVLLDCGDLDRVGPTLAALVRRIPMVVNIDHHLAEAPFGDVFWVDSSASSTCELLYDLFAAHYSEHLDSEIASRLYTGILTDTGSFRFSNTTGRALRIASELVALGADPAYIAQQIYDSSSPRRLNLLAKVLGTVSYYARDRIATAELTQDMFRETGTTPVDSEGFINHLRSVQTVEVAVLFREESDGSVRASLRSKNEADVAAFARRYGGGGHRRAAALHVSGPLSSVRPRLTEDVVQYLGSEKLRG